MSSSSVQRYFEAACSRPLEPQRGEPGGMVCDPDGNCVVLSIDVREDRIVSVQYKATTCMTLLALSEHLTELLTGVALEEARKFTAERLLSFHPEIPPERRSRADLLITALSSALRKFPATEAP